MNRLLKISSVAILAVLLVAQSVEAANVDAQGRQLYREGEVIVKYKDGVFRTRSFMNTLYDAAAVVEVKRFANGYRNFEHLMLDMNEISVEEAIEVLREDSAVEYVQPNFIMYALPIHEETLHEEVAADAAPSSQPCIIPGLPYPPGCDDPTTPPPGDDDGKAPPCIAPGIPYPPGCDDPTTPPPGDDDGKAPPCIAPGIPYPPGCDDSGGGGGSERPAIEPEPAEPGRAGDPRLGELYGLKKIEAKRAWKVQEGSRDVIVAVIDTGVDYNHPDLAYNMWRNPKARSFAETGIDMDGSEIAGDIVGWDFVHNDNLPFDDNMHGTHCAGTVGAVGSNGVGISGVAKRVSIMAIKFLSGSGSGDTADAIKAIDYAVSRGAQILSNSWGGPGEVSSNKALEDAIKHAEAAGVLVVAAAGNDGTNNDTRPMLPAAFPQENIIAVAATNESDSKAFFSNYGPKTVDVAAPGSGILSTTPKGGYKKLSGTSMAAPHVSGAAALIWSEYPNATYSEVKERLMRFGDPISTLKGETVTGMRINIYKALTEQL